MKVIEGVNVQEGGITDEGVVIPTVNRYSQHQVVTLLTMITPMKVPWQPVSGVSSQRTVSYALSMGNKQPIH